MAIAFRSSSTAISGGNFVKPAGSLTDDICEINVLQSVSFGATPTITIAGFTQIAIYNPTSFQTVSKHVRRVQAGDGNYSFTQTGSAPSMDAFFAQSLSGCDLNDPVYRTPDVQFLATNNPVLPANSLSGLSSSDFVVRTIFLPTTSRQLPTLDTGYTRRTAASGLNIHSEDNATPSSTETANTGALNNNSANKVVMLTAYKAPVVSDMREYDGTNEVNLLLKEFTSPSTETDLTLYEYDGTNQILLH